MPNFVEELKKLKHDLRTAITERVNVFVQSTGITPTAIEVDVVEVTNHADELRRMAITNVRVGLGGILMEFLYLEWLLGFNTGQWWETRAFPVADVARWYRQPLRVQK